MDKPVAVWRPTAEVAAFHQCLGGHGGAHAHLDAPSLAFGHAAEHGHDQVVRLVVGIDGAAHFGYPQGHAVVDEEREGVAELVSVEGALGFADHDRVETAVRFGESGQQGRCVGGGVSRAGRGCDRYRSTR
ncbi:hypothetical protein [Streptomyces odonnellii]|uniref:hypothetical protein n=1 Tax=Streptomyces odonnellii TaxID=1417980 RepID=UPI001E2ADE83|nr:hypothetical protein [Streptomyces odonnellii]